MHFSVLEGALDADCKTTVSSGGKVELSSLGKGEAESVTQDVVALKYVAQGLEIYRYANRVHRVEQGSFLLLPPGHGGEAAVDHTQGEAHGMCVYLRKSDFAMGLSGATEEPIVFPASASRLGGILSHGHRTLYRCPANGQAVAQKMLDRIDREIEFFTAEALQKIASLPSVKKSTRYENFRRANLARAFLHANTRRVVSLAELSSACRLSQFQLVRIFTELFGCPPSTYHRQLRLAQARKELEQGVTSCSEAAYRFGFGDPGHFSRAFSKAYGVPPSAILR